MNICPVYRQTGGHAYGSIYAGPIGAILSPQLQEFAHSESLPYASSLCGACYEVCPVKIDIPRILLELRAEAVARNHAPVSERVAMRIAYRVLGSQKRFEAAQKAAQAGRWFVAGRRAAHVPGPLGAWAKYRDLKPIPGESFREWWRRRKT